MFSDARRMCAVLGGNEVGAMSGEGPYEVIEVEGGVPVKAWIRGVSLEEAAARQLRNVARLPCVKGWVAAMPDVHWGVGATVGSVIPTVGAIIPAAVGVDIGCGMAAVRTTLSARDLPESLRDVRAAIERAVPHGRSQRGRDKGAWEHPPAPALAAWERLKPGFDAITVVNSLRVPPGAGKDSCRDERIDQSPKRSSSSPRP